MEITTKLYVTNATGWRAWLQENSKTATEVWLVYPKKHSGKQRITYNDAVEQALCFGWIDSTAKKLDDHHSAQRFTPRRKGSAYSQLNIERLRKLEREGQIEPHVLTVIKHLLEKEFEFPADILAKIKENKKAWKHFQSFPPAYKRIRIAFIHDARVRPDEFKKRLANFIKQTEKGKQYGTPGSEEYF